MFREQGPLNIQSYKPSCSDPVDKSAFLGSEDCLPRFYLPGHRDTPCVGAEAQTLAGSSQQGSGLSLTGGCVGLALTRTPTCKTFRIGRPYFPGGEPSCLGMEGESEAFGVRSEGLCTPRSSPIQ